MASIELDALRKDWPSPAGGTVPALDGVDLMFEEGELVAILGPSGCGKSTTLFLMAGIYVPTAGEIRFDGHRVNEVETRDRNVGIVFQSYALYPHMDARANIGFPLRFQKLDRAEARGKVEEAARLVQVDHLLDRKPAQLSGGQQQRVALARALVKRPGLMLLDEPLSNLDATLRLTMRTEIRRLQRRLGVTTVLVTHDQVEATTMADRIVCMNAGRVEQVGSADDLYSRPETAFVAGFIGSPPMNMIPGRVIDGVFATGDGRLPVATARPGEATLGIRPEDLEPAPTGLPARVETVEHMGRETLYGAETPLGHLRFLAVGRNAPQHAPGAQIRLRYAPDRALLFDAATGRRLPEAAILAPAA